jgi:SAM-dependent methyltransferase
VVLDVGGAAGVHAYPLAAAGYRVHLLDPEPLHVEQARAAGRAPGVAPLASAEVGDARRLPQPAGSADAVLLLGPLYHLTERADRRQALGEARRVLRPGGLVVAAAISRYASLLDGLRQRYLDDPAFERIVAQDLRDGQHRNPTGRPAYFTTAFFHHPEELRAEVAAAGLVVEDLVAVEGPAWLVADVDAWWDDPARRERLLQAVRAVEREPTLLGMSAHLLALGRAPNRPPAGQT